MMIPSAKPKASLTTVMDYAKKRGQMLAATFRCQVVSSLACVATTATRWASH